MDGRLAIKIGACLAVLLFCGSVSNAGVPMDSAKILALKEKDMLVSSVYSYKEKIHVFQEDVLRLKSDSEWLDVRMLRIEDQKRPVPLELKRAKRQIESKLVHHDSEIARLTSLADKHLESLRQLDARVKSSHGNRAPEWWTFDDWIYQLMYPGKKNVAKKRAAYVARNPSHGVHYNYSHGAGLRQDLEKKIKEIELDNWVALVGDDPELSLEVQLPILFGEGKSNVARDYIPFFKKLSWLLNPYPIHVEVAGYSDGASSKNQPLASRMTLGANRAANVVQELVESGMNPGVFQVTTQDEYGKADPEKQSLSAAMKRRVEVRVLFLENQN